MGDSHPAATFGCVARELGRRRLAFLCAQESLGENRLGPELKNQFGGLYVANEGFTRESAEQLLAEGEFESDEKSLPFATTDAVAFGKLFIANPDLPQRFARNASLNIPDSATFYGDGPQGYTEYPALPD